MPIGIVIALAELAVGLGALLGLWTRVAAAGGIVLSLTLFLTVSFHSSPYYTGADIVFLFAWVPLLLAGSGGVLSLDAVIASRVAAENKDGPPTMVPVRFELVQQVCGHYDKDTCTARGGQPCDVYRCPFLSDERGSIVQRGPDAVDRRTLVLGGTAVAAVGRGGRRRRGRGGRAGPGRRRGQEPGGRRDLCPLAHCARPAAPRRRHRPAPPRPRAPGRAARRSAWPARCRSEVRRPSQDPATGDPGLVLQLTQGQFVAFDAVCPHAGCTVGYSQGAKLIVCPCHGSEFDPTTGAVVSPPAPRGLTQIHLTVNANGELLADG